MEETTDFANVFEGLDKVDQPEESKTNSKPFKIKMPSKSEVKAIARKEDAPDKMQLIKHINRYKKNKILSE